MSNLNEISPITVNGHCVITDDTGEVLLDKHNAIHPQNMARIFARALANEQNSYINRIAFGNGGTIVDAALTITYRTPNDGQSPDIASWDSRLYHETFSKIIDDGQVTLNPNMGVDPGSADLNTGTRSGGGSVPSSDPTTIPHISGPGVRSVDLGLTSEVVISATINADEPKSQYLIDTFNPTQNTESTFVFDEIGLYTGGSVAINTGGYQYVDVGNRVSTDNTSLVSNAPYSFDISVDGGTTVTINFHTPITGGSGSAGEILYGDLCQAINTGNTAWGMLGTSPLPNGAIMTITDLTGGTFSSITGANSYGFLKVTSGTTGTASSVSMSGGTLFAALNAPVGGVVQPTVSGTVAGLQNAPTHASTERERLLAHLIFSPIIKTANRTLNITYTLTISVARTPR
jgi:hypothetical protein